MMVSTAAVSASPVPKTVTAPRARIQSIDWLRGLVMMLMTIDHAGGRLDAHHLHGDTAADWIPGTALPAGEFLTRWITHLCAPAFVLLAGASLALSLGKRGDRPGQAAFIIKRGLLIAALELWMSFGRSGGAQIVLQVLYAIGLSMVLMAWLRKLPSSLLLIGAVAIQLGGEWIGGLFPRPHDPGDASMWSTPVAYLAGALLFNGGPLHPRINIVCRYPLVPWLSMMMAGWVLGRWLLATSQRDRLFYAQRLAAVGAGLVALFAIVRGIDGYGNWGLHRDSLALLQWLHVAKYPPSVSYTALELGLAFMILAALIAVDDGRPRRLLQPFAVLGATALFYYLLHLHLLSVTAAALHLDKATAGLVKTYVGAAAVLLALYPLCVRYREYKARHPDGWTRYI
jgi:uncharacterized membrane protein